MKQITLLIASILMLNTLFGQELKTEKLADINLNLFPPTLAGSKIIYSIKSGTIKGKINGTFLPVGGDFTSLISPTNVKLDVREVIQTEDSATIYVTKSGFIYSDPTTFNLIVSGKGKDVNPDKYYFRATCYFETTSTKYEWLNHTIGIEIGTLTENGISLKLYSVK